MKNSFLFNTNFLRIFHILLGSCTTNKNHVTYICKGLIITFMSDAP